MKNRDNQGSSTNMAKTYTLLHKMGAYRLTWRYSNFKSQLYHNLFTITNSITITRTLKVELAKMILPGFNPKAQTKTKQEN